MKDYIIRKIKRKILTVSAEAIVLVKLFYRCAAEGPDVAIYTPILATISPIMSLMLSASSKNTKPITADAGGTRKNKVAVWLADPALIKYINIVKAPKDTARICQPIA